MHNSKNSSPPVPLHDNATTRRLVASKRVTAFRHTMIGKKIVTAVSGVDLINFVIAIVSGKLKIFSELDEINAYSRFVREPE